MKEKNYITHFAALMIVTVLCGLIYATVQHSYRGGANDPQLQMVKDPTLVTMVVVTWLVCAGIILLHLLLSHFTNIK